MMPTGVEWIGARECAGSIYYAIDRAELSAEGPTTDAQLARILYDAIMNADRLGAQLRAMHANLLQGMPGEQALAFGMPPRHGKAEAAREAIEQAKAAGLSVAECKPRSIRVVNLTINAVDDQPVWPAAAAAMLETAEGRRE